MTTPFARFAFAAICAAAVAEEYPWYEAVSTFHFPHLAAVDIDGTEMVSSLKNLTADYVLVEFYMPWCPHCQHFAPDFERLALALKETDKPKVVAATVDCVAYESTCEHWQADSYPYMLWGSKQDWLANSPQQVIKVGTHERTAEGIETWIREQLSSVKLVPPKLSRKEVLKELTELTAKEAKEELEHASQDNAAVGDEVSTLPALRPGKADMWDAQVATALLLHNAAIKVHQGHSKDSGVLLNLVDLLARRFPEEGSQASCRSSLAELARKLRENQRRQGKGKGGTVLPADTSEDLLGEWRLCGTAWEAYGQHKWRSCRGTLPGKRGYTCGLWTLFHALAARADDSGAAQDLPAMREAIGTFFGCRDCRDHFMKLSVGKNDGESRKALQLWWWTAHNAVNTRVKELEDTLEDGDAGFPKLQWPSQTQCPLCTPGASFLQRRGGPSAGSGAGEGAARQDWDQSEVVRFLDRFYGP